MGLDNFFMVTVEKDGKSELRACNYKGDKLPGILCVGMFGCLDEDDKGIGSAFRGKFYSPIADALLGESGWLYADRTRDEIRSAWDTMKPYYERFASGDADDEITELLEPLHYEYGKDDLMVFLTFFKYYGENVEDETLKLISWY